MDGDYENIHDRDLLYAEKIICERKTFYLDLKQNQRGKFVKITEDVKGRRDTILVPAEALPEVIQALLAIAGHAGVDMDRLDEDTLEEE